MKNWALILGASSGFGEAIAIKLAEEGMNIFGVHLDRRATLPNAERIIDKIKSFGREAEFFNINAADAQKRQATLNAIEHRFKTSNEPSAVKVVLHSLAFGTLKPYISLDDKIETITQQQMDMTVDVMAHSLVYWVQDLVRHSLMKKGSHIFAMTSSGGSRVWPYYGAVSAAKAALESHIRQLALELAPLGITANAIRAGVTDTPALRKIPGCEQMIEFSKKRNPYSRLTTTQDVAKAVAILSNDGAEWVTGNVIGVDGGEDIVG